MVVMIFAGTTEGRKLAEYVSEKGFDCYVSTATEYGGELLEHLSGIHVLSGRMDEQQIREFIQEKNVDIVIDATHPFATAVSEHIRNAAKKEGVSLIRCLRKETKEADGTEGNVVKVHSVKEAVQYLCTVRGNIFIATGSKELRAYMAIPDYKKRCYARVLSTRSSVEESTAIGFEGSHLFAMQGPFSKELNVALLRQTGASYFVTKESGKEGGFLEKAEAAREAGAVLVVIVRPRETGMTMEQVTKWLESLE